MTETPKLLYHYTTAQGLMGILKSNVLWASNLSYMNDFSELKYSSKLMDDEFKRLLGNLHPESGQLLPERIMNTFGYLENFYKVYACCFCEDGDQLSQWRAYAEKGTGYSVGFNLDPLRNKDQQMRDILHLHLIRVIYERNEQHKIVTAQFTKFIERAREFRKTHSLEDMLNPAAVGVVEMLGDHGSNLVRNLVAFKNLAFSEEKEWRLVSTMNQFDPETELKYLHFREMRGTIVPYIEMHSPLVEQEKKPNLPIVEIIQGPLLDPELGTKSLKMLLSKCGYNRVKVRPSRVPIRF